jgi:hypothetical protein
VRALVLAVLLFAACGSVTADQHDAGGTGGAGGQLAAAGGSGGQGGHVDVAGAGGSAGAPTGAAGASNATGGSGGAGGEMRPVCIGGDGDVQGFAYGPSCDAGSTLPMYCHADCQLNSAHFIGCSNDSRLDAGYVICHATCAECP